MSPGTVRAGARPAPTGQRDNKTLFTARRGDPRGHPISQKYTRQRFLLPVGATLAVARLIPGSRQRRLSLRPTCETIGFATLWSPVWLSGTARRRQQLSPGTGRAGARPAPTGQRDNKTLFTARRGDPRGRPSVWVEQNKGRPTRYVLPAAAVPQTIAAAGQIKRWQKIPHDGILKGL